MWNSITFKAKWTLHAIKPTEWKKDHGLPVLATGHQPPVISVLTTAWPFLIDNHHNLIASTILECEIPWWSRSYHGAYHFKTFFSGDWRNVDLICCIVEMMRNEFLIDLMESDIWETRHQCQWPYPPMSTFLISKPRKIYCNRISIKWLRRQNEIIILKAVASTAVIQHQTPHSSCSLNFIRLQSVLNIRVDGMNFVQWRCQKRCTWRRLAKFTIWNISDFLSINWFWIIFGSWKCSHGHAEDLI